MALAEDTDGAECVLQVEVLFSPEPRQVHSTCVVLSNGATVQDALNASGFKQRFDEFDDMMQVGIWSRAVALTTQLKPGDRVEIYRPLAVDPKEARRLRYKRNPIKSVIYNRKKL
jgi:uncharacterized protein